MVSIDYIETLLKDPLSSKTELIISCAEDFHFIGAIYLDGEILFSVQSTELEKILFDMNENCKQIIGNENG